MKIEKSTVKKLTITGAPALDPITVYTDDIGPHQGKITIECYGKSWSAYWGGCGNEGVAAFLIACNADYIANCLDRGISSNKYSASNVEEVIKTQLIERRRQASQWMSKRNWEIEAISSAEEARELWDRVENEHFYDDPMGNAVFFCDFYGEEWWCAIPESPNPDYVYLCRIITAVQQALKQEELQEATS